MARQHRLGVFILPFLVAGLFGWESAEEADGSGGSDADGAGEGDATAGVGGADADGYEADSEDDAARVKKGFRFDWPAYRAKFGSTPVHVAVTAMFAEYAKLYARIARQTTSSVHPDMTMSEGVSLGAQATKFVNDYITPILGQVNSTKVHKLLCHITDAIRWHGNLQNANTASNESGHKDDKPFYYRTNKAMATFTRQLVRHAHGSREITKMNKEADVQCINEYRQNLADVEASRVAAARAGGGAVSPGGWPHGGALAAAGGGASTPLTSNGPAVGTGTSASASAQGVQDGGMAIPYHRENVLVADLALRPELGNVAAVLKLSGSHRVRLTQTVDLSARFECGAQMPQRLRATMNDRGAPWLDHVVFHPPGKPDERRLGHVRAIVRRQDGDHALLCLLRPTDKDIECPLQSRGCVHLQWHMAPGATDVTLVSVPLRDILRIVHVVPDLAELTGRMDVDTAPADFHAPLGERMAMRFFPNAFFVMDA